MKTNVVDAHKKQEMYNIIHSATEEQDIRMLANMCYKCKPSVSKRLSLSLPIFRHIRLHYSYYIPLGTYTGDIDIAEMLFAKHGIYMERHESGILREKTKRQVLRCRHFSEVNTNKVVDFMNRIKTTQLLNSYQEEIQKVESMLKEIRSIQQR